MRVDVLPEDLSLLSSNVGVIGWDCSVDQQCLMCH